MTLNGAIMQLVEMRENSMMPVVFKPYFDKVIETISECVEPSEIPHWIPCSEKLPYAEYGESDTVLTTCGYRDVNDTSVRWIRLLYFNGGNWCYPTGETYEAKVYAWMPLPEPYAERRTDERSDNP